MCSTDYLAHHATKPDINSKSIALNDLEEPIKLTILSDIERDQHLNDFKESINRSREQAYTNQAECERKRKADHQPFDSYVKKSGKEMSDVQVKYNDLFGRYTKLQKDYAKLDEEHTECSITINGDIYENVRLQTLLNMKYREIDDLQETIKLYTPQSPPDYATLANIIDPPELDLKRSVPENNFQDFTHSENPYIDLDQDNQPANRYPSDKLAQDELCQKQVKTDPSKVYTKKSNTYRD